MKGFGTDEKLLIRTLTSKDPLQIEALKASFQRQFNRNLINDIEKETSGYLEYGLMGVARGPLLNDVYTLRDALKGAGTNEALLNDVLLSRSNADIQAIKGAYYQTFSRRLEDDVKGDLSGKTERHFLMVLAATRAEDSAPVVPQQVDQDVLEIYKASEGRMGTDELLICSIFTSRNDNQLRAIAHAYKQRYSKDLEKVIKSVCPLPHLMLHPLFTNLVILTLLGILWAYGGCSPLPAPPRKRQVHARRHTPRRYYGRCRHEG